MNSLLVRLRDRKLVKWVVAYLAVAWVLAQIAGYFGGLFNWPAALQRAIAVAFAAGALPAAVIAWFHGERGTQRVTGVEAIALAFALALTAGAGWWAVRTAPTSSSITPNTSGITRSFDRLRIAVLPLENLGNLPANAMFTGGFHDTLITQVARIPKLTVISRTSVLQWEGKRPTVAEVAQSLEVGTILEGSVQRDGDRVRIQAQLIDVATDTHLWAETFDRTVDDMFAVQSEIAMAIAAQLEQKLTAEQRSALETPPTSNPRAYEQLMLARAYIAGDKATEAVAALETAVALDPDSAVLFAELCSAHSWLINSEGMDPHQPAAKAALDRALELDGSRPEVQLALATYYYWGEQNNARAIAVALPALAALPNEATGRVAIGYLLKRIGRWQESHDLFLRAAELDPRNRQALDGLITTIVGLRKRDEIPHYILLSTALDPAGGDAHLGKAYDAIAFDGDLRPMIAALGALPADLRQQDWAIFLAIRLSLFTGDFTAARDLLLRHPPTGQEASGSYEEHLGLALRGLGDAAGARQQFELALAKVREKLERTPPNDIRYLVENLAIAGYREALLGNARVALEDGRRATELLPFEQDATEGAQALLSLANTYAELGHEDEAIATLERYFSRPAFPGPGEVWVSWEFASMRNNPRFRALLAGQGVDVNNDPYAAAARPGEFSNW
jgi:TolB-like protein